MKARKLVSLLMGIKSAKLNVGNVASIITSIDITLPRQSVIGIRYVGWEKNDTFLECKIMFYERTNICG